MATYIALGYGTCLLKNVAWAGLAGLYGLTGGVDVGGQLGLVQ